MFRTMRVFGVVLLATALVGAACGAVAGMGVGLAICRAIVEAHGGSIRASNPPEGGACVAFTLPRGNPPVIDAEPFASPGERP